MPGSAAPTMTDGALASIAVMPSGTRKRPMRSIPSITSDAFTQCRNINVGDEFVGDGSGSDTSPCKKPRHMHPSEALPTSASASTTNIGCAAAVSPSVSTVAGASNGTATSDAFTGQLGAIVTSVRPSSSDNVYMDGSDTGAIPAAALADSGAPSVDTCADNHAAEIAASRLESQIDDLTSDLGGWCLTDLKSWRRRRAAVAAAASASVDLVVETKPKEDGNGSCNATDKDVNLMGSPMASKGSYASPRKTDGPGDFTSRSPSVLNSPSEKEFLRQRRREARRSMLRGITSSGRRKLEV